MATPPPLPPESRPAGQVVGEAMRLYGRRLWPSLALGLLPAAWAALPRVLDEGSPLLYAGPFVGATLLSGAYVGAVALAPGTHSRLARAFVGGLVVFVPFQLLLIFYVFPAIAWFAAVGLVVPVLAREQHGLFDGFRRAFALARADFVHVFGSLAALTLVVGLATVGMAFVLRDFGDQAVAAAWYIAWIVASPLFFLGAALLYDDQAARVVHSRPSTRRRDADLRDAVDTDRPGRADPEVESGAAARGEP